MGEASGDIRGLEGTWAAFRDPERPRVFAVGELRYESVEDMKTSSSVTTVLIVGAGLEQVEIAVNRGDIVLVFGTLVTSNISSQPDLNSKVEGRVFECFEMLRQKMNRPNFRKITKKRTA